MHLANFGEGLVANLVSWSNCCVDGISGHASNHSHHQVYHKSLSGFHQSPKAFAAVAPGQDVFYCFVVRVTCGTCFVTKGLKDPVQLLKEAAGSCSCCFN